MAKPTPLKPKNSAGRDLKAAIGVGVGLGALVLVCIFVIPGWYPLVAVAVALGTWEVTTRLKESDYRVSPAVLIVGGQLMVWLSWHFGASRLRHFSSSGYVQQVVR